MYYNNLGLGTIIEKFKKDDCCFVVFKDRKIRFCTIIKEVKDEPGDETIYQIQDMIDWRYSVVSHKMCAETEKGAKEILRKIKGKT